MIGRWTRKGLTLAEMMIVVFTLSILTLVAVPLIRDNSAQAQNNITQINLHRLADVITNNYRPTMQDKSLRPGSLGMAAGRPAHPQLRYLFVNPQTETAVSTYDPVYKLGWNGPYLTRSNDTYTVDVSAGFTQNFGLTGDPTVLDGWGKPIVLTEVLIDGELWLCLNSAGPDQSLSQLPNIVHPVCRIVP